MAIAAERRWTKRLFLWMLWFSRNLVSLSIWLSEIFFVLYTFAFLDFYYVYDIKRGKLPMIDCEHIFDYDLAIGLEMDRWTIMIFLQLILSCIDEHCYVLDREDAINVIVPHS